MKILIMRVFLLIDMIYESTKILQIVNIDKIILIEFIVLVILTKK